MQQPDWHITTLPLAQEWQQKQSQEVTYHLFISVHLYNYY